MIKLTDVIPVNNSLIFQNIQYFRVCKGELTICGIKILHTKKIAEYFFNEPYINE